MRRFGFIAFIVIITSCTDHTYTLNFMKIDFPDQIANDTMLNVAISQAERFYEGRNSNTYNCKTDKESYQLGELVVLSIENISEDTIYLSPPKSNTGISFSEVSVNSHLDKETIRKSLVSENPAIHGTTSYYFTPSFVTLHLSTLGKMAAEELNVEAFDTPLPPKEKMIFEVAMSKRPGHYQFNISTYGNMGSWGLNKTSILSNSFQVLD